MKQLVFLKYRCFCISTNICVCKFSSEHHGQQHFVEVVMISIYLLNNTLPNDMLD